MTKKHNFSVIWSRLWTDFDLGAAPQWETSADHVCFFCLSQLITISRFYDCRLLQATQLFIAPRRRYGNSNKQFLLQWWASSVKWKTKCASNRFWIVWFWTRHFYYQLCSTFSVHFFQIYKLSTQTRGKRVTYDNILCKLQMTWK